MRYMSTINHLPNVTTRLAREFLKFHQPLLVNTRGTCEISSDESRKKAAIQSYFGKWTAISCLVEAESGIPGT